MSLIPIWLCFATAACVVVMINAVLRMIQLHIFSVFMAQLVDLHLPVNITKSYDKWKNSYFWNYNFTDMVTYDVPLSEHVPEYMKNVDYIPHPMDFRV